MATYITQRGDMIDAICYDTYGVEEHVHHILDVNPGLAELGPIYPEGIKIYLPTIETAPARQPDRIWGRSL